MIDLLVMTDGRDTIYETIPSAEAYLQGPISSRMIHDDSGDPANAAKLRRVFPDWDVVTTPGRSGFGGAIRSAWQHLRDHQSAPFVFHLEDDFTFRRLVPLPQLAYVLGLRMPGLVQMALRRQPWNAEEVAAGGIVELHPEDWRDMRDVETGCEWLESRRNFTTNPTLYRRSLILDNDWPEGTESEGHFGIKLLEDPDVRFGFWGARESGEWVHHIGNTRKGTGY